MKFLFANILLVLGFISSLVAGPDVSVQDMIEFRNATVENQFPEGMVFRIEICGRPAESTVTFNYQVVGDLWWEKTIWTTDAGQTSDGCDKRKYFLRTQSLSIPPFAPVRYFWSVDEDTEAIGRSPKYLYRYKDNRYKWKTFQDENMVVFWHDRTDAFGEDVKYIASRSYDDQAKFYATALAEPVTIVLANTSTEFFSWQDEADSSTGGISFPGMYLTVQVVNDDFDYHDWLHDVVPHEISHIYFNQLVKRYSGASHWLDEGLATYNEYSDHGSEWDVVKAAHDANQLLSLQDLEYDFGEDAEEIDLAYAQSYYAVLYMEEFYGKTAISSLLSEYGKGSDAAAAFEKSFGRDPEAFESDFVAWLDERLKTPPPNTELSEPSQNPVQTPIQANVPKRDASQDLTFSFTLTMLFLSTLGFLFILYLLKPRRRLIKKRKTKA